MNGKMMSVFIKII